MGWMDGWDGRVVRKCGEGEDAGRGERRHREGEMRVEEDEREREREETSVIFSTLASIVLALGECL